MQLWTIKRYLKSQWLLLTFTLISIVLLFCFLLINLDNNHITVFCTIFLSTIFLFAFGLDYLRKKKFYKSLLNYQIGDILDEEINFEEAKLIKEVLLKIQESQRNEIVELKESKKEYVEYIESWVHEIKTPIAAAKLMAENSKDYRLIDELSDIEDYVEQAMFYAKSSYVGNDYLVNLHSLDRLVKECIRKNKRYFILSKISVGKIECDEEVLTDEKWMLFILDQIVRNAIKYSKSNSVIDFLCVKHNHAIELQIKDYGVGIRVEDLPRIFDKGFTGKNGRDRDTHATGLGLYLAKKLCLAMHHELFVSSKTGNTIFSIWFPLEDERLGLLSNKTVS